MNWSFYSREISGHYRTPPLDFPPSPPVFFSENMSRPAGGFYTSIHIIIYLFHATGDFWSVSRRITKEYFSIFARRRRKFLRICDENPFEKAFSEWKIRQKCFKFSPAARNNLINNVFWYINCRAVGALSILGFRQECHMGKSVYGSLTERVSTLRYDR